MLGTSHENERISKLAFGILVGEVKNDFEALKFLFFYFLFIDILKLILTRFSYAIGDLKIKFIFYIVVSNIFLYKLHKSNIDLKFFNFNSNGMYVF